MPSHRCLSKSETTVHKVFIDITPPVLVGDGQKIIRFWSLQPFSAWFSAWGDTIGSTMTAGHRFFSLCLGHVTQVWWMYAGLVFERNNTFQSRIFAPVHVLSSVICSHNTPDHSTHFLFFRCIVAILFQHRILPHRSTASRLLQRMKSEMGCEASHWKVSRLSLRWGHPSHWNHRGGTIQRKCPKWLDPKIDQELLFHRSTNHQP